MCGMGASLHRPAGRADESGRGGEALEARPETPPTDADETCHGDALATRRRQASWRRHGTPSRLPTDKSHRPTGLRRRARVCCVALRSTMLRHRLPARSLHPPTRWGCSGAAAGPRRSQPRQPASLPQSRTSRAPTGLNVPSSQARPTPVLCQRSRSRSRSRSTGHGARDTERGHETGDDTSVESPQRVASA